MVFSVWLLAFSRTLDFHHERLSELYSRHSLSLKKVYSARNPASSRYTLPMAGKHPPASPFRFGRGWTCSDRNHSGREK